MFSSQWLPEIFASISPAINNLLGFCNTYACHINNKVDNLNIWFSIWWKPLHILFKFVFFVVVVVELFAQLFGYFYSFENRTWHSFHLEWWYFYERDVYRFTYLCIENARWIESLGFGWNSREAIKWHNEHLIW